MPVRFGVKELIDGKLNLHVVVSQEKIKTEVLGSGDVVKTSGRPDPRSVIFSLLQIARNVNSADILRYFPDGLLTSQQVRKKYKAISQ